MLKVLNSSIILAFIALVCGCNSASKNAKNDFKYQITMTELVEPSWYDLVDSVSYITLKSPDATPMGEISQIIVNDDRIYVLADGFYCFDMNGKCLFKQTAKGRARNEFADATSMSVSDGQLFIYDKMLYKGLLYDALSGRYISTVNFEQYVRLAYSYDDCYICQPFMNEGPDNARFNISSKEKPDQLLTGHFYEKEHEVNIRGTETWSNDDGLFYTSYRRNLAWKMKGTECIPYIKVTVPQDQTLPDQIIEEMIEEARISPVNYESDYIYGLSYITECDDFITGRLTDNHKYIYFIYDKGTGHSKFFYNTQETEPWQLLPMYERPSTGHSDCIYTICAADNILYIKSLLGSLGNEPVNEKYRREYDICNSLTDNDYAVVACIRFRRF